MLKRLVKWGVVCMVAMALTIWGCDYWVRSATRHLVYDTAQHIPHNKVGLVLGTSKYLSSGEDNLYYTNRMRAAWKLFASGKIDYVLVSGDNAHKSYNEPQTMRNDLVELGIPKDRIYLDFAGFRTLDSVVRCKAIFGQDSITVISQQFHNQRAIYLAQNHGIAAVGFNAKDVNVYAGFKTQVREKLARVKMVLDLLIGKEPKFYGEPIKIG